MIIKDALRKATDLLSKTSTTPYLDAEVLLTYVLKIPYENLLLILDNPVSKTNQKRYFNLINRRKKQEPVAYLIKNKEFYGLNFYVDKRVLIPRPETEILVEETIKIIDKYYKNRKISIVDVGTGSGCIPISLAKNYPNVIYYASDISKKALRVAEINIKKHKLISKINILHGDLLKPLNKKVDIITANLPYLTIEQINATKSVVKKYEPKTALLAGKTETYLYNNLLSDIPKHLKKEGYIFIEIDPKFFSQTIKLVKKHLPGSTFSVIKDLSGKERVLIIHLK